MPWAGPWWRTVTAQVIGRYFGEAQRMPAAHASRPARRGHTRHPDPQREHHRPQACWPLACCAGRRQCMGRARMERVRPCATHVHRSKLLFEMELDEIRYPPTYGTRHELTCHVRRSWPPDARSRHVVILKVGGAQPSRVLERYA